ncbi:hypothetical protein CHS0354_031554 [Potamilus streckersoni]|uniref:Uncharacterized protein n=1 Tax=Potamilus streckersoni TaxID=2493646 RepID=A0AAE0SYU5_9BIVA|nr:hypothetical protein CHS0354_031554 [Potamilus streckersoni]
MAISLLEAIRNGDERQAKSILQQRTCTLDSVNNQGPQNDGTPLFWACCQGFIEIVQLLILHGADINKRTSWGMSPLHACADNNQIEIAKLLLRCGAEVDPLTVNGDTPCHLASYRGHDAIVQALVEKDACLEIHNNKNHTPSDEAYCNGHYQLYRYLSAVLQLVHNYGKKNESKKQKKNNSKLQRLPSVCKTEPSLECTNSLSSFKSSENDFSNNFVKMIHVPSSCSDFSVDDSDFSFTNDLSMTSTDSTRSSTSLMFVKNIPC